MFALGLFGGRTAVGQTATQERVQAIKPPATLLPDETTSRGITKFSFIVYGDTRGRRDGAALQYEHSLVVDSILAQIKNLMNTDYPTRFILQSGDAVQNGREIKQWNASFVPLINRLTTEGGLPYFLVPGNHEATTTEAGMHNYLDAVSGLIPPEGSTRRLKGYATYSLAYGNTFVIAIDANIADDQKQYEWVKGQLEGIDRTRYIKVIVFCHQAPFRPAHTAAPTWSRQRSRCEIGTCPFSTQITFASYSRDTSICLNIGSSTTRTRPGRTGWI